MVVVGRRAGGLAGSGGESIVVNRPSHRLVALAVTATILSGCSGSAAHAGAGSASTTTPAERTAATRTIPLETFCGRVTDLVKATAEIGTVSQLRAVRADLVSAKRQIDDAASGGTPSGSGLFPTLVALDNDIASVNAWIQSRATQAELDHNDQPADVRSRFDDLGVRFRSLQAWSNRYCKAFTGSGDS